MTALAGAIRKVVARVFTPAAPSVQQQPSPAPAERPQASLYRLPEALIVVTEDRTTAGSVGTDHVTRLDATVVDAVLGDAILGALSASRDQVPVPPADEPLAHSVGATLKAAKRRSYRSFVRDAVLVTVDRDGDTVAFTPTRNGGHVGPDRGFQFVDLPRQSCLASSSTEVGRTARAALELAVPFENN